jgi:hypothetical protein
VNGGVVAKVRQLRHCSTGRSLQCTFSKQFHPHPVEIGPLSSTCTENTRVAKARYAEPVILVRDRRRNWPCSGERETGAVEAVRGTELQPRIPLNGFAFQTSKRSGATRTRHAALEEEAERAN